MLAALRTPAVEPHVGDVDVTRQHIDVDAGMVAAVAVDGTRLTSEASSWGPAGKAAALRREGRCDKGSAVNFR